MFLTDEIKSELTYFRNLHEEFSVKVGNKEIPVKNVDDELLYMLFSASLVMEVSEEELFENFKITDSNLTGIKEIAIDAYAFIDTEVTNERQLHIFQYKIHDSDRHTPSPKELEVFTTMINNAFVHPELNDEKSSNIPLEEMKELCNNFNKKRGNKITYKCHYITNANGILPRDEKMFTFLNRFDYDRQVYGFEIQVCGIKEITDLALYGKIQIGKEIITVDKDLAADSYRYENNMDGVERGLPGKLFIGMINVNELIRLQNKYHRNQLYAENIRLYLGSKGNVNKDIISTITSNDSHWFPYMNNGISIICDKLDLAVKNNKAEIALTNMQIINGCQTVNALYEAKYGESTKDDFKASKVLIKIYQIEPSQANFKLAIIKATNNQNAIKSFSLIANDPIQLRIQGKFKILNYLYDRKGEGKQSNFPPQNIIRLADATVAYNAVMLLRARDLRSGVAKSRVFKDDEYKKVFKSDYLNNDEELTAFSVDLLISSIIVTKLRALITNSKDKYLADLPIIKKSLYYLSGFYNCKFHKDISQLKEKLCSLIVEHNEPKIKNDKTVLNFESSIKSNFETVIKAFVELYKKLEGDKTDIDNLLKSKYFETAFMEMKEVKEYKRLLDTTI